MRAAELSLVHKRFGACLAALILQTFSVNSHAGLFTSDGANYEECMENRRGEIKNDAQFAIANSYCLSKHPPNMPPPPPVEEQVQSIRFDGLSAENRPNLLALINNINMNRVSVEVGELRIELINRNDFPISGVAVGILKKSGKVCTWVEEDYSDVYHCEAILDAKSSGSARCYVPNIEKRQPQTCLIGFDIKSTTSDAKRMLQRHRLGP